MKVMVGICTRSGSRDGNGKAIETAQRVVVAAFHRTGDFDGRYLTRQCREQDLTFQPGDQLSHTHMHAGAEADMTASLARDVVSLRIDPSPVIASSCPLEHHEFLALSDTEDTATDII